VSMGVPSGGRTTGDGTPRTCARGLLLAALVVLAASCGRGGAVPVASEQAPRAGGTLVYALPSDPASVTPLGAAGDPAALAVERNVFAGLVDVDPHTLRVVPSIARSWSASPDGRTFTFRLRAGVRFQRDAGAVTAATFVQDWSLLCSPRFADSSGSWVLAPIEGYAACRAGTGTLTGVRAAGPLTLVVHLSAPFQRFATVLADPATWAFPAAMVASPAGYAAFEAAPVGAGPFQVASWTHSDHGPGHAPISGRLVLTRNPDYFGAPAHVRRVLMPVVDQGGPESAVARFRSGELDVLQVPPAEVTPVLADPGFARRLVAYPLLEVEALVAPGGRPRGERVAVFRAAGPGQVLRATTGRPAQPADGPVADGTPGYVPGTAQPLSAAQARTPAAPVTVSGASPPLRPLADGVVSVLHGARIRARLVRSGGYTVESLRAPYPSPDAFLTQLLPSAGAPVRSLIGAARAAPQPGRGDALYAEAGRRLVAEAVFHPVGFAQAELLVAPRVRGLEWDGVAGPHLAGAWLTGSSG